MDLQFFGSLIKGVFLFSGNFTQSLLAYIGIVAFFYLLFPSFEGKMKKRLDTLRTHKLNILLIFLLASVLMTSYNLYQSRDMSLKQRLTDWAWKGGASVQELDPSINDLLGHSMNFALKMRFTINPHVEVVRQEGNSELLYFESPIDDATTLETLGRLDDQTNLGVKLRLQEEFLRAGISYQLEESPMYIYAVLPIEELTQKTFIETMQLVRKGGALAIVLVSQAK